MAEKFSIRFTSDDPRNPVQTGELVVSSEVETFEASIGVLSRNQYVLAWANALDKALYEREITCLIFDVIVDDLGNGRVSYFSLIPSEFARGADTFSTDTSGLFVTESFKNITVHPENLRTRRYLEFVDGSTGPELAVYFFDPDAPDRFFLYLDSSISNLWSRYLSNEEVRMFLQADKSLVN